MGATQGRQTAMLSVDDLFKGRHFDREIIVLCVRWYLRYKLSFRDLVEMMAERELSLAHTTIMRWIQRYVQEFEKRWSRFVRQAGGSGASMRPTSRSRAVGRIFTAPSTREERRSISCFAPSEMSLPLKRFSGGRSRAEVDCRRRSRSTVIKLRIERRVKSSNSIKAAREPKFVPRSI